MKKDPFKEYIKESEPARRDKGYAWHTAIGLQAVDGLKTSEYLVHTAIRNIEGEISFEEANALLQTYYEENPVFDTQDRTEEADKVSIRIAALLSERAFSFTPNEYISIHRKLFTGIYSSAGCVRDYNITKKEWVLDGATVIYGSATELRATLDYDFSEEKKFSYQNLSMNEIIHHFALFISGLWQIHVFSEGNTRTTAVFFIKYLRTLGFDVTNDIFAENAWYFRNSLVRANYNDLKNGIYGTTEYLELFLRNLLLNENHPLYNRTLHISGTFKETVMKQFEFRNIKQDETKEAVAIEQICFPPHEACSPKAMTERIAAAPELFLVAMDKETGKMAGFLNGVATDEDSFRDEFFTDISLHKASGKNIMLLGLDVLPEYRGQSLAREIVKQYAKRQKEKGREKLILTCLDAKVEMYEKMGFSDNGIANSTWGGEEWHEMYYVIK